MILLTPPWWYEERPGVSTSTARPRVAWLVGRSLRATAPATSTLTVSIDRRCGAVQPDVIDLFEEPFSLVALQTLLARERAGAASGPRVLLGGQRGSGGGDGRIGPSNGLVLRGLTARTRPSRTCRAYLLREGLTRRTSVSGDPTRRRRTSTLPVPRFGRPAGDIPRPRDRLRRAASKPVKGLQVLLAMLSDGSRRPASLVIARGRLPSGRGCNSAGRGVHLLQQ